MLISLHEGYNKNLRIYYDLMLCLKPISLDSNNRQEHLRGYGEYVITPNRIELVKKTQQIKKKGNKKNMNKIN